MQQWSVKLIRVLALVVTLSLYPLAGLNAAEVSFTEHSKRLTIKHRDADLSLLLRPSEATATLAVFDENGNALTPTASTFSGTIEHEPDSWVRLSIDDKQMEGLVSWRGQYYRIRTAAEQTTLTPLATNLHRPATQPATQQDTLVQATSSRQPRDNQILRRARIAVVVDSQYNQYHRGRGLEKALSIINSVDGIYRHEFGLSLAISTAVVYTDLATDPHYHGDVSSEQMLRRFRHFRMAHSALADACLVHLFTGNSNSDRPVGLAWINTACRTDGYDVSFSTPYRHDILLAAHEIAHNLGAKHDAETYCGEVDSSIMSRVVSTQTSQYFSECTRAAIAASIARFALLGNPAMQAAVGHLDGSRTSLQ